MIWVAILLSVVIYGVIAWVVAVPVSEPASDSTILILHVVAFSIFAAAWFVPRTLRQAAADGDPARRTATDRKASILQWAMLESAAIIGLLVALLAQNSAYFFPLGVLSFIGILLAHPVSSSEHHVGM